jgi:hypothetical protein
VASEAVPSPTDVANAAYPEALHLIVSLRRSPPHGGADDARGGDTDAGDGERAGAELGLWRIAEGVADPVVLEIVA